MSSKGRRSDEDSNALEEVMSVVDGCRSQFMCGTEFHQVSMVVLLLGSMVVLL